MNPKLKLHWIFDRFMAPAGDGEQGGASAAPADRGDEMPVAAEPVAEAAPAPIVLPDGIDPDAGPGADPETGVDPEADPKDSKKREARIPLSRHEAILAKERDARNALEQKLAQFQRGTEVAQINEDITKTEDTIIGLEKEYTTLLADGEVDKASAIMSKIRSLDRQVADAKSDMKIAAAEGRALERARYTTALERIETAYPRLNADHESYDKELMSEVVELKAAYEGRGMTPTAAMQKAVKLLVGSETTRQEAAIETTPRVAEKDVAKEVAAERKKDAVAKTSAAVGKQPPSTTKVGLNSDVLGGSLTAKDVMKLNQADFSKLSEDVLARLRGDEM